MTNRLILAAIMCLAYEDARADAVEIPLPELEGTYAYATIRDPTLKDGRQVSFNLGGTITQINEAWIRWSGSVAAGWGRFPGGGLFRWVGGIDARLNPPAFGGWTAAVPVRSSPWEINFDVTQPFVSLSDPGWEFLYDGTALIEAGIYAASYLVGDMIAAPTATITEATLILDVTFAPTPVESSTWGRVKALYRR